MADHHIPDRRHGWPIDIGLRLAGLAAVAIALVSFHALARLHGAAPHAAPTAVQYMLAALGCVGTSGGGALLILGHHIFDEVELSERWARVAPQDFPDQDLIRTNRRPGERWGIVVEGVESTSIDPSARWDRVRTG